MPAVISIPNAGADAMLGPLVIQPNVAEGACRQPCSLLQSTLDVDAAVFVLQHRPGDGLVRLAGATCRQRTTATIVRRTEQLQFPIPQNVDVASDYSEQMEWLIQPGANTYYVIAVTDAATARHLANVIDALPLRCSSAFKPGLSDDQLRKWMTEFALEAARYSAFLDWRAVEIVDGT